MMYIFWAFVLVWISIIGLIAWSMYWFDDIYRKKLQEKKAKPAEHHGHQLKGWFSFMAKARSKDYDLAVDYSPFPADEGKSTYIITLYKEDIVVRQEAVNFDEDIKMTDIFTKFSEVFTKEESNEDNK